MSTPPAHAPSAEGFVFTDFGDEEVAQDAWDNGPHFSQPRLSLVGDAAVVMGECYRYHVKAMIREDELALKGLTRLPIFVRLPCVALRLLPFALTMYLFEW